MYSINTAYRLLKNAIHKLSSRLERRYLHERLKAANRRRGPAVARQRGTAERPVIIGDGIYGNVGHFFRLRLFLEALPERENCELIGLLSHATDVTERRQLEQLGFRRFLYIDDAPILDQHREAAHALLSNVGSHADMLSLALPDDIPAYIFYDTVLKERHHPRPPLDDDCWCEYLAQLLRNLDFCRSVVNDNKVARVVLSHPWKNEFAALLWQALGANIPTYHLSSEHETIRIYHLKDREDYRTPKEVLSYREFCDLPETMRGHAAEAGLRHLEALTTGMTSDINGRNAYRPDQRLANRRMFRETLGLEGQRPLILVYTHAWFDFPHIFAMSNFVDFLDWFETTLAAAHENDRAYWLFKPHPLESWYGHFHLKDIAGSLPSHIRILPADSDTLTSIACSDTIVTLHGSIAFEAAARSIPVICGDRSFYSDWRFAYTAQSRDEYGALLGKADRIEPPHASVDQEAAAFAYFANGHHPANAHLLKLHCDSETLPLTREIIDLLNSNDPAINHEIEAISAWLREGHHSYSVYQKVAQLKHSENNSATVPGSVQVSNP